MALSKERIAGLTASTRALPHPEEALIDLMREAQAAYGYLSDEAVEAVADIAGVSPARVDELATFYSLIFRRPVGKKVILVCDSISCFTMGSEEVVAHLKSRLGVELGGTTADGAFTLLPVSCLGRCAEAPAMLVGEKAYGNLTPQNIDDILKSEHPTFSLEKEKVAKEKSLTKNYDGLKTALKSTPEEVAKTVLDSGLRGRGGAGFPAGKKWSYIGRNGARHVQG